MENRIAIFLCFLLFLCHSCITEELDKKIINVDIDDIINQTLKVDIVKIIPLETSQDCLIGIITKAEYFHNRFYVLDAFRSKTFFVFDEKGRFINKTTRGKGPGEVIGPFSFTINKQDSVIILHDQSLRLNHIFNLDLGFIRSEKVNKVLIMDFYHINKDSFLVYHHDKKANSKNIVENFNYALITDGFRKEEHLNIQTTGNKVAQMLIKPVSIYKDEILFVGPWNYNVYQLHKGEEQVKYQFDFGNYNINPSEMNTLNTKELTRRVRSGNGIGSISSIFRTEEFLLFGTYFKGKSLTWARSLYSNRVFCLNDCFDSNTLPISTLWGVDNGEIFGLAEPRNLVKFIDSTNQYKELVVAENSNPWLISFTIKEQ